MNEKTYIIANKKYKIIKVGRSKKPHKDLKEIRSNEVEMVCVFEGDVEEEIKGLLKNFRVRGEWYYPNPKTLLEIQEKYLPNSQDLTSLINNIFRDVGISGQPICLCWIEDEESGCQYKRYKHSLVTCESYEIWSACVKKEI